MKHRYSGKTIGLLVLVVSLIFIMSFNVLSAYLSVEKQVHIPDFQNATYIIEGTPVQLIGGAAHTASTSQSASSTMTFVFGNEVVEDLNNDGRDDVAFLLTRSSGDGAIQFYAAVALDTEVGLKGSHALYLGDAIAPQTTSAEAGVVTVNFVDQPEGEDYSAPPTRARMVRFLLDSGTMQLIEI